MRDAAMAAAFEDVPECDEIVAQVGLGALERMAYAGLRRQVDDSVEAPALEQRRAGGGIGEIDLLESKAGTSGELCDARTLQRDVVVRIEIVDAGDARTRREERARGVHADESGRSGHQHTSGRRRRRVHRLRSSAALRIAASCSSARSLTCFMKLANGPIALWANPAAPSRKPSRRT